MNKIFILLLCAATIACNYTVKTEKQEQQEPLKLTQEEIVARGKYLVTVGACHDCHSPKIMTPTGPEIDTTRLLSGHPQDEANPLIPANSQEWVLFNSKHFTSFVGPWGVSFAANLTPSDYGTGNWTFEQFKTALRKGKYKGLEGSRDLLPPMPWQMYKNFTDEDMEAIFTYLRSLKPVDNQVPAPISPQDLISKK